MRGIVLYGPRDVRFEDRETSKIAESSDATGLGQDHFGCERSRCLASSASTRGAISMPKILRPAMLA